MRSSGVGILFRVCAPSPSLVASIVVCARENMRSARRLGFSKVVFVVSRDFDCGETANCLERLVSGEGFAEVLQTSGEADSVALLKKGFRLLEYRGIKYVAVVSFESARHLTRAIVQKATNALEGGKKVVGVNFVGQDRVIPISNDCAFWDIDTLFDVGGFQNNCGIFETTALLRLAFNHDSCAAIIMARCERGVCSEGFGIDATKREQELAEVARINTTLRMVARDIALI